MSEEATSRAMLRVPGMQPGPASDRVTQVLQALDGVSAVVVTDAERLRVDYDPTELTVMDLIRALRRIGFLSGVE